MALHSRKSPSSIALPEIGKRALDIVMITPELAPIAKVGGLGDVVAGLSRTLIAKGHNVDIFMPMHQCLRYKMISDLKAVYNELWVQDNNRWYPEQVFHGKVDGLSCYFFTGGDRFQREAVYGYDDDIFRYAHFCRAAMEYMYVTNRVPDILHGHDWTVGLAPVLLFEEYAQKGMGDIRAAFTIHNIEYQGVCWYGDALLKSIGLNPYNLIRTDRLQDDYHHNLINLMKAGIVYSNVVTTVSPTYAKEIRTVEGAKGLDRVLWAHKDKVSGILNGIDCDIWNPATDVHVPVKYDVKSIEKKAQNKTALQKMLGLKQEKRPVVCCISRLVEQKGLHLIRHAIHHTLFRGGQFVLLGYSPEPSVNEEFRKMGLHPKNHGQLHVELKHNEELAHLLYAGADMLLQPSLFEPCGLTQLIALRYGTVPVVRSTGGLADTVFDVQHSGLPFEKGNGYLFNDPDFAGLNSALDRALDCWYDNHQIFMKIAANGMAYDFSWGASAEDYAQIYQDIRAK